MISGSNEKELDIANQIADLLLEKENLQQENKQLKEDIIWWTNRFRAVERDNRNLKNEIQLRIKSIEKLENDIIKYQRKIQELKEKYK